MSPPALLSGVDVKVNGTSLDPSLAAQVLEVRVESHLMLPDMFSLRIPDPDVTLVDDGAFAIGNGVEILFQAPGKSTSTSVFKGQITSLEPEFSENGAVASIRGYDRSHLLNTTPRTETYQSVTFADIARTVAQRTGLTIGTVDDAGGPQQFVQQSNETDLMFLWRLATPIGFEVVVDGTALNFRHAGGPAGQEPVPLAWGVELLSFRPRATGIRQVSEVVVRGWDPSHSQAIVGTASSPTPTSTIGLARGTVVAAMGSPSVAVCDHPVSTQEHATAVAEGIAEQLANAFVDATGLAYGDPRLRAGAKVTVSGVGSQFSGTYALSETTHVFRSARGYHTQLRVCGRARPGPAATDRRTGWHHPIVVGIVTNNNDPNGLGRVRVKYPGLDPDHEGWWARLTAPSAGTNRGLMMMPVVGDEVVLAFEHDSTEHPYVLGSVWNGQALPQTLFQADGSFSLRSDHQLIARAAELITVAGEQAVALSSGTDMSLKATGQLTAEAQTTASLKADTALTLQGIESVKLTGAQVVVEAEAAGQVKAGASLQIQAGGSLQITGAAIQIQADGILELSAPQIMLG
ncbi:MAG TPA: VgrG-related protein [Solirubrobacteraceae bacterium]|nr:VgrG-related protein [Solirubrobacteraceae bacterium]